MSAGALRRLPLVVLYLSERCNSRCASCDYWRHGRSDLTLDAVRRMLPDLAALETEVALLSGGEPLLNPEWPGIARLLRSQGLRTWLLTSGLALAKHAAALAELCECVTVSLDGADPPTDARIRGLDAFEVVCTGIRAAVARGIAVSLRVTLQRANYRQLLEFVALARALGVRQVSFLAVDVANPHAFARRDDFTSDLALERADLPLFERLLEELARRCAADFASGFIAESPAKLNRLLHYFAAVCGQGPYPPVRCNAPQFSAVIAADGGVRPCFFIPGPPGAAARGGLASLNTPEMLGLRTAIAAGAQRECSGCVCPMWRDPHAARIERLSLAAAAP